MNNSIINRQNQNASSDIEALEKLFYSARKSIPSIKKNAAGISSLKKATSLPKNASKDVNKQLSSSIERLSFLSITCNLSINSSESSSLPFFHRYFKLFESTIHNSSLKNDEENQNVSGAKIEEYFSLKPSTRSQLREKYVAYVKSIQDVFDILDFGNVRSFTDAYDSAVDLLAECDENVISSAVEIARKKHISTDSLEIAQSWEKNWEILIKAVSCGLKIEPYKKMSLLLSLCDSRNKLSRLVKLTLIDAIVDLDLDQELIMVMLQIFVSERESDNFVRNYAGEQAKECL